MGNAARLGLKQAEREADKILNDVEMGNAARLGLKLQIGSSAIIASPSKWGMQPDWD